MSTRNKNRNRFFGILTLAILAGIVAYPKILGFYPPAQTFLEEAKVNLGLDLQGGIHLEYKADVSKIESGRVEEALQAAQDVVERRINAFGVGESLVQTAKSGDEYRIVVELPGIKDIEEAKKRIKDTPVLEFKEEGEVDPEIKKMFDDLNVQSKTKAEEVLARAKKGDNFEELAKEFSQDPGSKENGGDLSFVKKGAFVPEFDNVLFEGNLKNGEINPELVESQFGWHIIKFVESKGEGEEKEVKSSHILFAKQDPSQYEQFKYKETGLTGKNLEKAQEDFPQGPGIGSPQIALKFDEEGTKLFAEITKRNIGKPLAIFLDGELMSAPTVQVEITNGEAVITGNFTIDEVKEQVRRLNEGSIPVPLELVGQNSIEASLGAQSLQESLKAGTMGMIAIMIFMIVYYRVPGLIASIGIIIYVAMMVSIFKLSGTFTPWPITLSLSGIAGFILTIGMAVDANVLIFERMREELRDGKSLGRAMEEGFRRAWPSIKDGNLSTILTSVILIMIGTSFVKGFALILVIGVLMSMFTAIVIVRVMMKFIIGDWFEKRMWLIIPTKNPSKTAKLNKNKIMRKIIQKRKYTYIFSITLTVASAVVISMWGLNLGIDFKGGTLAEYKFSDGKEINNQRIQESFGDVDLKSLQIQKTGENSYLLRYAASDEETNNKVFEKLKTLDEGVKQMRVDFVGGSVSGQIKRNAVKAIIWATIGIALYIAWAFRKVYRPVPSWHYGIGAIIALMHDIIITVGVFSVLGKFWGVEVGVPFIAALLTILGYSVNDTIVVYDRTRENLIRSSSKEDFEDTVNRSLNETLARSINTSMTVIIVLIFLVLFGGESIKYFSIALLVGIGFGTYSSIFVASALLVTSYKMALKRRN